MRYAIYTFSMVLSQVALADRLLPKTWEGTWVGTLQTNSTAKIAMTLVVDSQPDSISWKMQYQGQRVRDYRLYKRTDGQLILDEGNNVELKTTFVASLNALVSHFQVDNQFLTTTYVLESPTQMRFELTSSSISSTSAARIVSFPISAFQRAVLTKN